MSSVRLEQREAAHRDDMKAIWEQKYLNPDRAAIKARRRKALERLALRGKPEATLREIDRERAIIEDEMFIPWYVGKKLTGFAGV